MTELPMWRCHKVVRAIKIGSVSFKGGNVLLQPEDGSYPAIVVGHDWAGKRAVRAPGYYIVYDDGYTSWSPVAAFERGYTPLTLEVVAAAPCGCTGFLHANGCSDQNVPDPLGAILNPEQRRAVRDLLKASSLSNGNHI